MKTDQFLSELHAALEIKSLHSVNEKTCLKDLEEYDSMMILGIIAFVDEKFNKSLTTEQLNGITDFKSLMDLIGLENFD